MKTNLKKHRSKYIPENQEPTKREFLGWREVIGCFAKSIARTTENDCVNSKGPISYVDLMNKIYE